MYPSPDRAAGLRRLAEFAPHMGGDYAQRRNHDGGSGQRCVSASRILIHESKFNDYILAFTDTVKRLKFGDPLDPSNFAGPLINKAAMEKVSRYNALAKEEATDIYCAGKEVQPTPGVTGHYLSPCVYTINYNPKSRCIREEVFGPHVALIPFPTDDDAVHIHNDTEYGLSMAVITESYRRMRFFREECDYGMGYVNLPSIGAEVHLPFGGVKKSGNGHPSASGLVEAVTHKTAWTVNHGVDIRMAQGLTAEV